jgi:NAD-dependent DNA ligase
MNLEQLRRTIKRHDDLCSIDSPEITDQEYDRLKIKLNELEEDLTFTGGYYEDRN